MREETRPWGRFEVIYEDERTWLKRLFIAPGQSLSLQYHQNRQEFWVTWDEGVRAVMMGANQDLDVPLQPGCAYYIGVGDRHRLYNPCDHEVSVLEWAVGEPSEDDIVRIHDPNGR